MMISDLEGMLENLSPMTRSSSSLEERVVLTATVQLYHTGSAFTVEISP